MLIDVFTRPAACTMLALALLFPVSVSARSPVILEPAGKWHVNWAQTQCTMARAFGKPEQPDVLVFQRYGPSANFHLTVISKHVSHFSQGTTLWLGLGNAERAKIAGALPGKSGDTATIFVGSASLAEPAESDEESEPSIHATPEQEAAVSSVTVSYSGKSLVFNTGPLDRAFAALRACTDDLVKSWGLDPKQQATLSQPVTPLKNPRAWLRSEDYPTGLLIAGKQAIVNFRLMVSAQGEPTACEIQGSIGDKPFDQATCAALMRRARFGPALDAQGKSIPSYYLSTVKWVVGW